MNERKARRMAAQILKVGKSKIWVNPGQKNRFKEAMTKEDIRALIKERIIRKRHENQQSRARARKLAEKKKKGRKRGKGKRKGTKKTRVDRKGQWVKNVRAQRKMLRELKKKGVKFRAPARKVYLLISGNYFRGKNYVKQLVEGGSK